MKVVIADSSCLILLTNIDKLDLLASLYSEVLITDAVQFEYGLPPPSFISIKNPVDAEQLNSLQRSLDPGEASSIALALENPGCQIIIDEKKGRRIALAMGLDLTGTLGVLTEAAKRGLLLADRQLLTELETHGFRLSTDLKNEFLSGS
jgi:predicted nucleic acid-binding protein